MRSKVLFIRGLVTEADVANIYREALSLLKKQGGKTIMEWKSTDIENALQFTLPVEEVIYHCDRFLRTNWPEKYGQLIKKTTFDYRWS